MALQWALHLCFGRFSLWMCVFLPPHGWSHNYRIIETEFGVLAYFFCFSFQWIMPFTMMLVFIPNVVVAYVVAVSSGLSVAASLLLPWWEIPFLSSALMSEASTLRRFNQFCQWWFGAAVKPDPDMKVNAFWIMRGVAAEIFTSVFYSGCHGNPGSPLVSRPLPFEPKPQPSTGALLFWKGPPSYPVCGPGWWFHPLVII